jgi:hypothetical protein
MTVKAVRFGPGTLKLGTVPTDFSCQVQSMAVNVDKDEGDALTVLCGDSVPGSIKYAYTLAGTLLQDFVTAGLQAYTWSNAGKSVVFEFVPQTGATGHKVSGNVVIDPMAVGTSDGEFGDVMTADVEWSIVGTPTVTWASVIPTGMSAQDMEGESDHATMAETEPATT